MHRVRSVLIWIFVAALIFLVFDGFRTGGVWVRGSVGEHSAIHWNSHKVYRDASPAIYWFAMTLYAAGLGVFATLAFRSARRKQDETPDDDG